VLNEDKVNLVACSIEKPSNVVLSSGSQWVVFDLLIPCPGHNAASRRRAGTDCAYLIAEGGDQSTSGFRGVWSLSLS